MSSTMPKLFTLNCYILGDEPSSLLPVEISTTTANVGLLRNLIKAENVDAFQHVDAEDLTLWAVSFPTGQGLIKSVNDYDLNDGEALPSSMLLSQVFPLAPDVDRVHILVQTPFIARQTRYNATTWNKRPPPSILTKLDQFEAFQTGDGFYACSRPQGRGPDLPLVLVDPVFATFIEESEMAALTDDDYAVAMRLRYAMCQFYDDDDSRACALHQVLYDYGITCTATRSSECFTKKGHVERGNRPVLIMEVNNEIAEGNVDSSIQAMLHYDTFCYEYQLWKDPSVHPCFLVSLVGCDVPYLTFSGCALSDRPMVEKFSLLPLTFHQLNGAAYDTLARHLLALKNGVNTLLARFSRSISSAHDGPSPPSPRLLSPKNRYHLFPYPTTFASLLDVDKGEKVDFSYIEEVASDKNALGFIAETKKGKVCIKFVQRYGEEVHRWCSEQGFASTLLGLERLPGEWLMVVTEHLDTSSSWVLLAADRETRREELKGPIQRMIARLHEQGMVHGDIRDTGIMVKKTEEGLEYKLINFDWAGRIGEVKYPWSMDQDPALGRPATAKRCAPILPEHDDHMVQRLFS